MFVVSLNLRCQPSRVGPTQADAYSEVVQRDAIVYRSIAAKLATGSEPSTSSSVARGPMRQCASVESYPGHDAQARAAELAGRDKGRTRAGRGPVPEPNGP